MENKAVILNKYESIEKCIKRVNEEYAGNANNLNIIENHLQDLEDFARKMLNLDEK